jgi:hypothetical protein
MCGEGWLYRPRLPLFEVLNLRILSGLFPALLITYYYFHY